MRRKNSVLQIFNIITFVAMIIINWLANRIPIGGYTTGAVSSQYPNLFTPSNITFSIWGVIYLLLGIFVYYQSKGLFFSRKEAPFFVEQIGGWFILSCVANISWLYAWHYRKIPLSLLMMVILLFSLIRIYENLNIGRVKAEKRLRLWVYLPFQIYLGWIVIATIANITTLLVYFGWDGMGLSAVIWTLAALVLGTYLACRKWVTRGDAVFSLVIMWAYLGIIIRRISEEPTYPIIVIGATLCMATIVFFMTSRKESNI